MTEATPEDIQEQRTPLVPQEAGTAPEPVTEADPADVAEQGATAGEGAPEDERR